MGKGVAGPWQPLSNVSALEQEIIIYIRNIFQQCPATFPLQITWDTSTVEPQFQEFDTSL
jgi:hypothetical protein